MLLLGGRPSNRLTQAFRQGDFGASRTSRDAQHCSIPVKFMSNFAGHNSECEKDMVRESSLGEVLVFELLNAGVE